jgi:hypothetical protein
MFRASLAHPQEARYTHHNCVRLVLPEVGQVMSEICRGFEFKKNESDCEVYRVGACY